MFYRLIQGHILDVAKTLLDESVDLVCFSPPYWSLRDYGLSAVVWDERKDCGHKWSEKIVYQDNLRFRDPNHISKVSNNRNPQIYSDPKTQSGFCVLCGAWKGQFGLEPHPQLYIDHLVSICESLRRVMKKEGSMYVNLGDTYCGYRGNKNYGSKDSMAESHWKRPIDKTDVQNIGFKLGNEKSNWLQPKQKMLMPHRFAIAMQDKGWIVRNNIVWYKRNHMPSSAKDRLTNSFEFIFHFVKSRKYFFDLDAVRIPHILGDTDKRKKHNSKFYKASDTKSPLLRHEGISVNPKGKNPGDTIFLKQDNVPSKNAGLYKGFNKRWRESQVMLQGKPQTNYYRAGESTKGKNPSDFWDITTKPFAEAHFAVYPPALVERIIKASCPKDGVVLDPFLGSGTTMLVAQKLRRNCIGIELSEEYCKMIKKRCFGGEGLGVDSYEYKVFDQSI